MRRPPRDYYRLLAVSRTASSAQIKRAYHRMAKRYHPDRNPGDRAAEERFKDVSEAYEVLSDSRKRATYDNLLRYQATGLDFVERMARRTKEAAEDGSLDVRHLKEMFSRAREAASRTWTGGDSSASAGGLSLSSFMDRFFSRRVQDAAPEDDEDAARRGDDVPLSLAIGASIARHGGTTVVAIPTVEVCPDCRGTGSPSDVAAPTCADCQGRGSIAQAQGSFSISRPCGTCLGRGILVERPCVSCEGRGERETRRRVSVRIPAGVRDGQRIRLKGLGHRGVHGGEAGDLLLRIALVDETAPRPADDPTDSPAASGDEEIQVSVNVDPVTASIGGVVPVRVPGVGRLQVKVPPNTRTGACLHLADAGPRGEPVAVVVQVDEQGLSDRARELMQSLDDDSAEDEDGS